MAYVKAIHIAQWCLGGTVFYVYDNMLIVTMYKQYVAIYIDYALLYIGNMTYNFTHVTCVTIYRLTKSFMNVQHMICI